MSPEYEYVVRELELTEEQDDDEVDMVSFVRPHATPKPTTSVRSNEHNGGFRYRCPPLTPIRTISVIWQSIGAWMREVMQASVS